MFKVPTSIVDRFGVRWLYAYGYMYASPDGRVIRHRDSLT